MDSPRVVIIGAGPYGLSTGAHLASAGCEFRMFGVPMGTWVEQMPDGMFLKSEPWASNLSDPAGYATLRQFCAERKLPYEAEGWPVPLKTFVEYGQWFQGQFIPEVESARVTTVARESDRFRLQLCTGESFSAQRVVVAVGLTSYARTPPELAALPQGFVSHSSEHRSFDSFRNRHVTVIGGGQSALESAALLHEAGADVRVLARHRIQWPPEPPGERPLVARLRQPRGGLGYGWKVFTVARYPAAFRQLPAGARRAIVRRALGPAGSWWLRERVVGRVPVLEQTEVRAAEVAGDCIRLRVSVQGGPAEDILTEHVVAATGYRVDVDALSFLDPTLRAAIDRNGRAPALSATLESSVPGLYFTGIAGANTFGPLLRFVFGTDFAARRLARALT